jgi:hypothetical protein
MNDPQKPVYDLISRAVQLGHRPEGIAAAEEAVRHADALEDAELSFTARETLMENAAFGGAPEKLLVAFSWCLAKADRDPNWESDSWRGLSLLWRYKWVVGNALDFPGISRARILSMIDDFRRRSQAAGYNERPALDLRFTVERRMGHFGAAQEWLTRSRQLQRDGLADCEACDVDNVVAYLVDSGRHEEALKEAQVILTGGMGCAEVPHKTHASLLESCWALGRVEEAAQHHTVGYGLVRQGRSFVEQQAEHLHYLVRVGQPEKAATLLRKHLPWALESRSGKDRFRFLLAARTLLQQMSGTGVRSLRLRIAPALCPAAGKTTARVADLLAWVEPILVALAQEFDARNESSWFSAQLIDRPGDRRAAA